MCFSRTNTVKKIIFVGPTGHGKSSIVYEYAVGADKPRIGHDMDSATSITTPYNCTVGTEEVIFFDTPGLGDSEKRDQEFIIGLVDVLQSNCDGIQKFYFVMQVHECRFNEFLQDCLTIVLKLAPDLIKKPSVLTLVLSKVDAGAHHPKLSSQIAQLRSKIIEKFEMDIEIIVAGVGNMAQLEESIKNSRLDVFCQTQHMVRVQTLDTLKKQAEAELEQAQHMNAAAQQEIGMLQKNCDLSLQALRQAEQQTTVDKHQISLLQTAYQQASQNAETARQNNAAVQQQILQLQQSYQKAEKDSQAAKESLTKQIAALTHQIQQQNSGGGGRRRRGCVIS